MTQLSDLTRGRVFFPKDSNYQQTLQILIKALGSNIRKIEWKRDQDYGLHYHGILHVDLEFNGIKFELQIVPIGFKPFIELQHQIYQLFRDEVPMNKNIRQSLITLHNDIFNTLEKRYL